MNLLYIDNFDYNEWEGYNRKMNFKQKSRQYENQSLNKYLDSLDQEDEIALESDYINFDEKDYDTHDKQWESLHGGDYFDKSIHFHRR